MSELVYPHGLQLAPGVVTTETAPTLLGVRPYRRAKNLVPNVWEASFSDGRTILTEGPKVVRFGEQYCTFTQADWIGKPFTYLPWQKGLICELFELGYDEERDCFRRRYHEALIGTPKKNGKSDTLAALGHYFMLADGDVSPVVAAAAANDTSANLVFKPCKVMVENGSEARQPWVLRELLDPWEDRILVVGKPAAELRRVPASPRATEGLSLSINLLDEWHEWTTPAAIATATKLLNGNVLRPNYLNLRTTTAGAKLDSLCGEDYAWGEAVAAGEVDAPEWFFRWYAAPENVIRDGQVTPLDWRTEEAVRLANPSFGALMQWPFYRNKLRREKENSYRRYFLNQWREGEESWMPDGAWGSCEDLKAVPLAKAIPLVEMTEELASLVEALGGKPLTNLFEAGTPMVLVPGEPTAFAVDASYRSDSTAVIAQQKRMVPDFETGEEVEAVCEMAWIWEHPLDPETRQPIDNWIVPKAEVKATLRALFRTFKALRCEYDPAFFHDIAVELAQEGYQDVMREFSQNNLRKMVEACQGFYQQVVRRRVRHNGDRRLARHIKNAVAQQVTTGAAGWTLRKGAAKKGKMDAAVASVMCYWGLEHPGEEPKKPKGISLYVP